MEEIGDQRVSMRNDAPAVGDHLALDLLNTQARDGAAPVDYWHTGSDVLRWLARCGIALPAGSEPVDEQVLLAQMHALRAVAREAVTRRKRGETVDPAGLNAYLESHVSSPRLLRRAGGELALAAVARGGAIPSLLGPVAQAVAQLLVDADFDLVRQCEHPECVLWFYDRTKAHKRRWCSMALCGNRHKAAQFRKRGSAQGKAGAEAAAD
jgi:predicted RNA-binding Zn ribbon-like protein